MTDTAIDYIISKYETNYGAARRALASVGLAGSKHVKQMNELSLDDLNLVYSVNILSVIGKHAEDLR